MKRQVLYLFFALILSSFTSNAQVSITGVGATGGWGDGFDADMTTTDNNIWTLADFVIPGGEMKFRFNHSWDVNWGFNAFPTGTGVQGGANIPAVAGTYTITFNQTTGVYSFAGGPPISVVKIVGSAVNAPPEGLTMTTANGTTFSLPLTTFLAGNAQFSIDGSLYGGSTFPMGTASDPVLNIPVTAGDYTTVSVNIATGEYNFVAAPIFPLISITGSAVGGWGDGHDFDMTTTDGINYTYIGLTVIAGEAKFRQGHAWATAYGDVAFPSGTATTTGGNIATLAGTYIVTFNLTTGAYTFAFAQISITGDATGGWGDGFDFDLTTTDGATYFLNNFTIANGQAKFRLGHAWATAWGGASFPTGVATTTGANIPVVAGVYGISFNLGTGAYDFGMPLSTTNFVSADFKVYPNPTQNSWNFNAMNETIEAIQIVDMLGKTVLTVSPKNISANIDASSLSNGIYFAKVATATKTATVKLLKN